MTLEQLEKEKELLQDKLDKLIFDSIIEKAIEDNIEVLISRYTFLYEKLFFIKYVMRNSGVFSKFLQDASSFYPSNLVVGFKDEKTKDACYLIYIIDDLQIQNYKKTFLKLFKEWKSYAVTEADMSILNRIKCFLFKNFYISLDSILLQRLDECSKSECMVGNYENNKKKLLSVREDILKNLPLCIFPSSISKDPKIEDFVSRSQLRRHPELIIGAERRLLADSLIAEINKIKAEQAVIQKALE